MGFVILFFQFLVVLGMFLIMYEVGFLVAAGIILVLIGNNFLLDLGTFRRKR